MLGVNNNHGMMMMKRKGQSKRGNQKKDVKVTYISSPVKVKTSASNFRALVQELTGQASNVAEMFMEADDHHCYVANHDNNDDGVHKQWNSEAYFPHESTWLKHYDDYSHSMDIFNTNF